MRGWPSPILAALALLAGSPAMAARPAIVAGRVADAVNGAPLPAASVRLDAHEIRTDDSGRFVHRHLAARRCRIQVRRLGYHSEERVLDLHEGESLFVAFELRRAPLALPPLEVGGRRGDVRPEERAVNLTGARLRQSMGRTIAETLAEEPGLAVRSMGPAPARPVLRGLSGNRLLVLADGERTGDLSATASDHAVAIEPLMSRTIEVVRGPSALLYGANAIAGVVDVHQDAIPSSVPEHPRLTVATLGETVHRGGSTGARALLPHDRWVARAEGIWRRTGDLSTAGGRLRNSWTDHREHSGGVGWIGDRVSLGLAGVDARSGYGIPGGFLGGHANGVDIQLERSAVEGRASLHPEHGPLERLTLSGRSSRYYHREIESNGVCGVSFGVLTYDGALEGRWAQLGSLGPGVARLWGEYRDYAQGCLSFTPPTLERGGAVTLVQEARGLGLLWQGSARWERRDVTPARRDSNKAGRIGPRSFDGWSGGLSATASPAEAWTVTATAMTTHQAPGVEELFSEGPHLAAYAYEIGNGALDAERAFGFELGARYARGARRLSLTAFLNEFPNYVFVRDTGALEVGPGEEGLLERFQYDGQRARLWGGEASAAWPVGPGLVAEGVLSVVTGDLHGDDDPIPLMPPPTGRLSLRRSWRDWSLEAAARGAAAQRRLGAFEDATAAWLVGDVQLEYAPDAGERERALVVTLENVTDAEYRQHLSRVKSVRPEPGRSLKVMVRVGL